MLEDRSRSSLLATALVLVTLTGAAHAAPPYEIVLMSGTMDESDDTSLGILEVSLSWEDALSMACELPEDEFDDWAGTNGTYERLCESSGASGFQIVYSRCSMNMVAGEQALRITLPDGGGAEMRLAHVIREKTKGACKSRETGALYRPNEDGACQPGDGPADHRGELAEVEVVSGDLRDLFRTVDYPGVGEVGAPTGDLVGKVIVKPAGGGKPIRRAHWSRPLHARKYEFSYQGTMSPAMIPAAGPVQLGKVWLRSEGTAWIADDAPGAHIIREFYSNFQRRVVPSSAANSLMGGMIAHLAELTKHGVPLELEQKTSVKIMGVPTFGKKGSSTMAIHDGVHLLSGAEWCATGSPPKDWKLVSLEDFYTPGSPTVDGAQPAGPALNPDEAMTAGMSEAQTEIDKAYEEMSPLKKKLFGKLLGKSKKKKKGDASDPPPDDPLPGVRE